MFDSLVGCSTASSHRAQVMDDSADRLTVGKVQKEIVRWLVEHDGKVVGV